MTISREYRDGPFVVQCDECSDVEELAGETLREAAEDAKAIGYTPKLNGNWEHYCEACS